ncbi:MAG TPA: protein-L-isoaspartate(D-aspartate) O-methyltransferase [Pseudomonadales bacterium]|jgi:protein-L-isoaspartate(D-aspartate) O-methyltransferase|nr:protein-L-isoaspartate(D-aspartate) O-methyltransferase [Pseudomonadales bacterium]HMW15404.1 protein-L-isoaspartate(D-aspartate) O-methyltransferase [Pseudomonadales bacterium]HMW83524.1 protein-L-isoaspartate(D-aspartate) O-methyltransferase [Pseudomonadales bacterium]HMY97149.1 protein-L-isoaspartate(D-aspartate) O-methyltransferase [Pseudomonadales bacterium]HMZ71167.1 protein-L-isoaspartate(D-aspartate) O-methyltransferase [Pseudomonadales bacterium]
MRPGTLGIGMTSVRTRERLIDRLRQQGISNRQVLEAMREVPRHLFIDEAMAHHAYEDKALPIGFNQTISQPYTVARMLEALLAHGTPEQVLEVGTGSGYQTALLAELVPKVFTIERIRPLLLRARQRLRQLGYRNVLSDHVDGHQGWPGGGEFGGIIVSAAPATLPEALLAQLAAGGCMVTPVGRLQNQLLKRITRSSEGLLREETLERVLFVPLIPGALSG